MAFNITDITSAINKATGLAKPNQFFVMMTPPTQLASTSYPREAMFFCDAAQLPGINFSAQPIKMAGYGSTEQRPYNANFNSVQVTFIVDAKGKALDFFTKWAALLNNWTRETQGTMAVTGLDYGEWNYPETYEGTVEINQYDPVGKQIITYQLYKAYPIQVGDVNVAWEQNDTIMRLPVTFAYNVWSTKNVPPSSSGSNTSTPSNNPAPDIGPPIYFRGLELLTNGEISPQEFVQRATTFANSL